MVAQEVQTKLAVREVQFFDEPAVCTHSLCIHLLGYRLESCAQPSNLNQVAKQTAYEYQINQKQVCNASADLTLCPIPT